MRVHHVVGSGLGARGGGRQDLHACAKPTTTTTHPPTHTHHAHPRHPTQRQGDASAATPNRLLCAPLPSSLARRSAVRLVLNAAVVHLQPVSLHDTQVDISLGPIPGINVGSIVDKIIDMVPDITKAISGAIKGPITHALADVLPKLGCIKL